MKHWFKEIGYWIEDRLKSLCGEITPDKRLTVILIMLLLFTILNLYFTFTTISNWGREQERKKQLKIEHIKQLELWNSDTAVNSEDSINNEIDKSYGRKN